MIQTCIDNKIVSFADQSEVEMILYNYKHGKELFNQDKYIFNEQEWNYILPELNRFDLLDKLLFEVIKKAAIKLQFISSLGC